MITIATISIYKTYVALDTALPDLKMENKNNNMPKINKNKVMSFEIKTNILLTMTCFNISLGGKNNPQKSSFLSGPGNTV